MEMVSRLCNVICHILCAHDQELLFCARDGAGIHGRPSVGSCIRVASRLHAGRIYRAQAWPRLHLDREHTCGGRHSHPQATPT
eukprot:9341147-Pyramimonas_sp.AAC.1